MAYTDFSISITDKAVDVRYTPSEDEPRGKLNGFIFIVSGLIIMNCALLFIPDKGSSMWLDMKHAELWSPKLSCSSDNSAGWNCFRVLGRISLRARGLGL